MDLDADAMVRALFLYMCMQKQVIECVGVCVTEVPHTITKLRAPHSHQSLDHDLSIFISVFSRAAEYLAMSKPFGGSGHGQGVWPL